jgi:hypothetical protein
VPGQGTPAAAVPRGRPRWVALGVALRAGAAVPTGLGQAEAALRSEVAALPGHATRWGSGGSAPRATGGQPRTGVVLATAKRGLLTRHPWPGATAWPRASRVAKRQRGCAARGTRGGGGGPGGPPRPSAAASSPWGEHPRAELAPVTAHPARAAGARGVVPGRHKRSGPQRYPVAQEERTMGHVSKPPGGRRWSRPPHAHTSHGASRRGSCLGSTLSKTCDLSNN